MLLSLLLLFQVLEKRTQRLDSSTSKQTYSRVPLLICSRDRPSTRMLSSGISQFFDLSNNRTELIVAGADVSYDVTDAKVTKFNTLVAHSTPDYNVAVAAYTLSLSLTPTYLLAQTCLVTFPSPTSTRSKPVYKRVPAANGTRRQTLQ